MSYAFSLLPVSQMSIASSISDTCVFANDTCRWCLLEIETAVKANIPIILMRIANASGGDPSLIGATLDDLPTFLEQHNPGAVDTLSAFGTDANSVANTIRQALVELTPLTFDPHQSSAVLKAQIQQLAEMLVDKACPENKPLLRDLRPIRSEPWITQRKFAVLIVHEKAIAMALEQAKDIKQWLLRSTELEPSQIVVQSQHVGNADTEIIGSDTDCVLVLQTANVLLEPECLESMYIAIRSGVPIVPVVLLPSTSEHAILSYNFETAKSHLESLDTGLDLAAATALKTSTGDSLKVVGMVLSSVLPNIISKPLGLGVTQNEIDSQMAEIERALRQGSASNYRRSQEHTQEDVNEGEQPQTSTEDLVPGARP